MSPDLPPVDLVLAEVRALMADAGAAFKIVGGVAVVHHGYPRTTEDVDVLIGADALPRIDAKLAAHGFERAGASRLRHTASGVLVDLLVAGSALPRAGAGVYPSPETVGGSPRDAQVADLPTLIDLKLRARRHRDVADVVELLKRIDDAHYIDLESRVDASLRADLAKLRQDALDELATSP
jgi:hypothetical protein